MTKTQWKALYDFCEEFGCTTQELLEELKENGTVPNTARLSELSDYVSGTSYDAMIEYLGDNV